MVIGREWNSCFSRLFDRLVGVGLGVERNAEQMEIAADDMWGCNSTKCKVLKCENQMWAIAR